MQGSSLAWAVYERGLKTVMVVRGGWETEPEWRAVNESSEILYKEARERKFRFSQA